MVETHSNGAAFECVTGHQWADRLIELGRQLLRARQSSDQQQLRIALIQPTLAFSETFVAMGYLLQKYLSEEHCLKSTARDTKWDEKLMVELAYVTDASRKTPIVKQASGYSSRVATTATQNSYLGKMPLD